MPYRLTHHARERMQRYGIREADVAHVLEAPEHVAPGIAPRRIAQGALGASHVLRVIFEEEEGIKVVVTVYKARRSRYEV